MPASHSFEMRIGLKQRNLHRGYEWLMDVADPSSANYGRHWTQDEITGVFSPSATTVNVTKDWVVSSGIGAARIAHSASGGWLVFNATVDEAEKLLDASFWLYENDGGQVMAGCDEPRRLCVSGRGHGREQDNPEVQEKPQERCEIAAGGGGKEAPGDAQLLRGRDSPVHRRSVRDPTGRQGTPKQLLGLYERECWYQDQDLDLFFANYAPGILEGTCPLNLSIDLAVWHYSESDTSISIPTEADLDTEVAYPIIYPQTVTVYQVDDEYYYLYQVQYAGLFNTFLDAIDSSYCNYSAYGETGDDPMYDAVYPDTHTVVTPGNPDPFDPGTYKGERMCGVISMSWARRRRISTSTTRCVNVTSRSLFMCSWHTKEMSAGPENRFMKLGLQGVTVVASSGDSGPSANSQCGASNLGTFWASSPGNCPYVTSVGATKLETDGTESFAMDSSWSSSGGFSRYYPTPAYQQPALATYFADHDPGSGDSYFSTAPAVGSQTSPPRVNEERLAVGKGPVGFINPVLYANPTIFNDITKGNNSMCGVSGFQAVGGWDPTTGLGTVQYPKLLEIFIDLS
ncbi:hypothetical protein LQW54_001824 [Pestalotiopsis sp. IQ-011]